MKLILTLLLISFNLYATNNLVKQGPITVNFDDIDGYTIKIPAETRSTFFYSPDRLNTTIDTMVKMKHIVNYGINEGLITKSQADKQVQARINEYAVNIDKELPLLQQEVLISKLKNYLYLEELYREMKVSIKETIKLEDVLPLAEEFYLVNKMDYYAKRSYDFDYVNVIYNEQNKNERMLLTNELKKKFKSESIKSMEQSNDDNDIVYVMNLVKYKYNEKYTDFSDFIFRQDNVGVAEEILDAKGRFIIAVINKISPERLLSYDEVKEGIVRRLLTEKFDQEFGSLLLKLTKDPIDINRENIDLLKTRYSQN